MLGCSLLGGSMSAKRSYWSRMGGGITGEPKFISFDI